MRYRQAAIIKQRSKPELAQKAPSIRNSQLFKTNIQASRADKRCDKPTIRGMIGFGHGAMLMVYFR